MTRHPTPEQVQTVIDNLISIQNQANKAGAFDIEEAAVSTEDHTCGTVHCVGGWYAVANKCHHFVSKLIASENCDFEDGGELMAADLGFSCLPELEEYLLDNPAIWGNDRGDELLANLSAYNGLTKDSQNPMTIIIQHWQQVKKNLENLAQG